MKRKITFFALPQLWGIFGRVGLFEARASSGSLARADNATAPKPAPAELRKWRRLNGWSIWKQAMINEDKETRWR